MSTPSDTTATASETTQEPQGTPAAAPTASESPSTAAPDQTDSERLTFSREDFQARMDRAFSAKLSKLFGTSDPEQLKAMIGEAEKVRAEAEERRKAEMSEIERIREEKAELEQRYQQLEAQHEQTVVDRAIAAACSKLGISDVEYANYRIEQAVATAADDDDFDIDVFLAEDIKSREAQYGVTSTQQVPASTTADAAPPHPDASPVPSKSPSEMTPSEYRDYLQRRGIR